MKKTVFTKRPKVLVMQELSWSPGRNKLHGIFNYANERGKWNIYTCIGRVNESEPDELVRGDAYDGIIVGQMYVEKHISLLKRVKCPVVLIDALEATVVRHPFLRKFPVVRLDEQSTAQLAAEHLTGKGVHRFAFVHEPCSREWSVARSDNFARIVGAAGCPCRVFKTVPGGLARDNRRLRRFIAGLESGTGVWCATDFRAIDVMHVCSDLGMDVPRDIAVLGVDDDKFFCEGMVPSVSSVAPDQVTAGYNSARALDILMRRKRDLAGRVFPYKALSVTERESTNVMRSYPNIIADRIRDFIRINITEPIKVGDVVAPLNMSRRTAEKFFKREFGKTILDEIRDTRYALACKMLSEGRLNKKEVAERCGYTSPLQFFRERERRK